MTRPDQVFPGLRISFLGPQRSGELAGTVDRPAGEGYWIVRLDNAIYDRDLGRALAELRVSEAALSLERQVR